MAIPCIPICEADATFPFVDPREHVSAPRTFHEPWLMRAFGVSMTLLLACLSAMLGLVDLDEPT